MFTFVLDMPIWMSISNKSLFFFGSLFYIYIFIYILTCINAIYTQIVASKKQNNDLPRFSQLFSGNRAVHHPRTTSSVQFYKSAKRSNAIGLFASRLGCQWGHQRIATLWSFVTELWKINTFHRLNHLFLWAMFHSYVSLPKGKLVKIFPITLVYGV